ncbi:restriction endonuclease [Xanthocytophaga flava]|uniref:restriction endonuclease n=1 Tax=Xanthocytophaga flava TaxID=3048013 RepID=UPI0036F2E708
MAFYRFESFEVRGSCLNIIPRSNNRAELSYFDRNGFDQGVDIVAIEWEGRQERPWFIQCKRYSEPATFRWTRS